MKKLLILTFVQLLSCAMYGQSFEQQIIYDDPLESNSIIYHDFNDDGIKEYIVANNNTALVSMVCSNGTDLIVKELLSIDFPTDLVLGDFDNDGRKDIAIASLTSSGITILKNLGNLEFSEHTLDNLNFQGPSTMVAVDIDFDDDLDLIIANAVSANVLILEMVDPSSFSFDNTIIDYGAVFKEINIADLNNDGLPDIVGTTPSVGNKLCIYFNRGSLNFEKTNYQVLDVVDNCIADFNGDGLLDIGVSNFSDTSAIVFLNNGDETFEETILEESIDGYPWITSFDINQDGRSDIILGTSEGLVVLLLEDITNNILTREEYFFDGSVGPFDIHDIDADGDMDIVASAAGLGGTPGILHYINTSPTSTHTIGKFSITVSPNPATDHIKISTDGQSEYSVSLYNLAGKLVKGTTNSNLLRLENVSSGIYIIEIEDQKTGQSIIEKIVVAK